MGAMSQRAGWTSGDKQTVFWDNDNTRSNVDHPPGADASTGAAAGSNVDHPPPPAADASTRHRRWIQRRPSSSSC